jgi:hypothetical protein
LAKAIDLAEVFPQVAPVAEAAIQKYERLLGRPGFVAQATGGEVKVVPWYKSARRGTQGFEPRDPRIPVPEHIVRQARESLPPLRRRTPAERLKAMTDVLIEDAIHAYKATGTPVIAQSVVEDICRVAALEGWGFMTPEKVRRMTLDQIRPLLEAKAKRDFTAAGWKQQESDRRKVVLDWHGHRNNVVQLARTRNGGK